MDATLWPLNKRQGNQTSARVSPLAKLPIFWDLKGKRVVIAGGSEGAAWKAELLAACGAMVHIYAQELSDVFSSLVDDLSGSDLQIYAHHARPYTVADLKGASLAIGDFDNETDAEIFLNAGIEAGVPVNVIDKPAFCQFQFGSIVNRSPVIVSISTDGAAPILAQAIRRRIEAILPASLQLWAQMAQGLRGKVNDRLESGRARRRFWEGFVDRVFIGKPNEAALTELLAEAANGDSRPSRMGKITFLAAGPGDPELLTLKAIRALQAADIVLFGPGVSNEILEFARREARRTPVDRRTGQTVDYIAALLDEGKNVVRIELGNPAGADYLREEIAALEQFGIRARMIPGVIADSAEMLRCEVATVPFSYANAGYSEQAGR
ncbi:SAM-dependent methyltransferase [Phyllobacterium sp. K27]